MVVGIGALAELITGKHGGEASVARDPQEKLPHREFLTGF
jgi:hypothetical protein